ncbi:cobalt-precorrin-5B (C(1))-methyltransferase CbiD [Treponema sp.]|uniref:cobalt-precorrin-5B (C(1))-methyltransferase CbiD n=1 Tax=Treponema sp. TaxID=166 RepID=UPI00388D754F
MIKKSNLKKSFFLLKKTDEPDFGFTTGTCAQAASIASARMLLTQKIVEYVILTTPKGIKICIEIENQFITEDYASCSVQKYSGTDPDVTNGIDIFSKVTRISQNMVTDFCFTEKDFSEVIKIKGGKGVGKVTLPGLDQKPGEYAINSVPRKMILESVKNELIKNGRSFPLEIEISIPKGEELASKTFNPKLGITGGISVLGTSGIVEPMSDQALLDTIQVEMNVRKAQNNDTLLMVPGNYGCEFLQKEFSISLDAAVHCSNFVYDAVQMAVKTGFKRIIFCGHIGKLIKVAGGRKNTHSKYGDGRSEIFLETAKKYLCESDYFCIENQIKTCISTEQMINILDSYQEAAACKNAIMQAIADKIQKQMIEWSENQLEVEVILFTKEHGLLAKTQNLRLE